MAFQYLNGSYRKEEDRLFSRVCCNKTRGNGFKLKEGRFKLDIRKKLLAVRAERQCRIPANTHGQTGQGSEH